MSINATIDGTTYEGITTILVGGKTVTLSEVEDSGGGGDEPSYPALSFFNGANTAIANGKMACNSLDNRRACVFITESVNGGVVYVKTSQAVGTAFPDNAYPLYIPEGATKVTVVCTGMCCAINVHKDVGGVVTAVDNGHWSEVGGETDYDLTSFIASGATHLSIGLKLNGDANMSSTTVDDTTVQVSFS